MDNTLTMLVKKLLAGGGIYLIGTILVSLLIVYFVLCFLSWLAQKRRELAYRRYRPKKVMDAAEESFFKLLYSAVSPELYVFPHVSMRALVETNHWDFWATFDLKRVDFVICDPKLNIVCVVELEGEHQEKRHLRREALLRAAGVKILRYRLKEKITPDEIRKDVFAFVKGDIGA